MMRGGVGTGLAFFLYFICLPAALYAQQPPPKRPNVSPVPGKTAGPKAAGFPVRRSIAAGAPHPTRKSAADSKPEAQPVKLPDMAVTATRIRQPLSEVGTTVTVLTADQMRTQKIQTVATALRQVPGLEVAQSGGAGTQTDVSIRGSTAAQTMVMIDGVPVNTGASGGFNIANQVMPGLSRIEVVRGAGGSLYGTSAIGGVINLMTEEGHGPPTFTLLSEGGSRSAQRTYGVLSGSNGKLGYTGSLNYSSTDGFGGPNSGSDNLAGIARLDYHLTSQTTVRAFSRYNASNVDLYNYSLPELNNLTAHERSEFIFFKGEMEHRFTKNLTLNVNSFFVRNEFRDNETPYPGNLTRFSDDIPDEFYGTNAELLYDWGNGTRSLAGFNFKNRWMRAGGNTVSPEYSAIAKFHARRREYAGYLEQEKKFFEGLIVATGGVRVDGNSQFGKEASASWAVSMPIKRTGTIFRANYSEGFRAPAFNELYYPNYGNPSLQPELSSEYDGGITQALGERLSLTATYFSRRVHSMIVTVPCPSCLYLSKAGNAGRVDIQGLEAAPSFKLARDLTLSGNFTYIDETHVSLSPSTRPLRVPKFAGFGLLQYIGNELFLPHDKVAVSLAYTFVGGRQDLENFPPFGIANHGQYHLIDLTASYACGYAWGHISNETAFIRVENLFDRRYEQVWGFLSPPFNLVAGLTISLS